MNLYNKLKGNVKNAREDDEQAEVFSLSYRPNAGGIFNFYLFGVIDSPKQFVGAVEVLRDATEDDEFVINLQTPGGSLAATDTLLQAIANTKAHVHINATGDVCSAGTAIMLAGDSFTISDHARFMIHNGSAGSGGKTSDYKAWALSDIAYMEQFMQRTYEHFFTEEELKQLIDGKDFWLTPAEFVERSERRNKIFQEQVEKAQQEAVGAFVKSIVDSQAAVEAQEQKPKKPRRKKATNPEEAVAQENN